MKDKEQTQLKLRIITPSCLKYDGEATMVVMPGQEGEFGILANHMSLIASLSAGAIKIYQDKSLFKSIDITSGVVSVSHSSVDVLLPE